MLTRKGIETAANSISIQDKSLDSLLSREWLLTNSRGGFSASSIIGCNTRRYHGLLIGTLNPPANRTVTLSNCLETIRGKHQSISLSCFEFDKTLHPKGFEYLLEFHRDLGVHFEYELGIARLTKSVYLLPDSDVAAISYDFSNICEPFEFSVRPLAAMRDFHSLQNEKNALHSIWDEEKLAIRTNHDGTGRLALRFDTMRYEQDPEWWHRFLYRIERDRGQDCYEDLWSPGVYSKQIDRPQRLTLWAGLFDDIDSANSITEMDLNTAIDAIALSQQDQLKHCPVNDPISRKLFLSAGQFIIERTIENDTAPSILAGYPWFLDWGRDTFIALEGLCLSTGHEEIAKGVLKTFAKAVSEGMIPNRFDDYGNEPHYNSIDASLWFVHAAFALLRHTGDHEFFANKLLPALKWIMDAYRKGTRFGICADKDKLITGGDVDTQLTWMDAKFDGISFTPRYGKAVEINALWYSNLCHLAEYFRGKNGDSHHFYREIAEQVRLSFQELFWNEAFGYLNDCVFPNGKADTTLRPNQIFAVSLPYSPLSIEQQRKVVTVTETYLLTSYGLRSLSPTDPRYKGRYEGYQGSRDAAYHQGTVWAFLIGPFVEAYLKTYGFDPTAKRRCRAFLLPLLQHLTEDACLGSISEIFDGDGPHYPRGACAQAWSVAEVLRAWQICREEH